jgi:hypothetical protein
MTIEKQVLAVYFMHRTIADETISQFKDMGGKLLTELFRFINEDFVDTSQLLADEVKENESSLLERIRLACQETELQAE